MHATRLVSAAALVLLALAVQSVSAVSLSPRGVGQVLIYPYYTVNKSQDTLLSVVNASAISKAVQVRVLEGYNGRDTLAFVLYLSPHDVWTASISQTSDEGGAAIKTSDVSCTSTPFPANGQPLRSAGYDGTSTVPADGGPTSITRTREGFIELIVGADITPGSPTDVAVTHVQDGLPGHGMPPGCATLNDATTQADEVAPTGGIYGSASIVNVGEGTFFPYNADALQGFTDIPLFDPASSDGPTLADANSNEADFAGGAKAYLTTSDGTPIALDYAAGIDAVSAVFMVDSIYNEYVVATSLGANTDWVITFPTKNFYVDPRFGAVPFAPFSEAFAAPGESNVLISGTVFDREEGGQTFGGPCELCPPPGNPPMLAYQVNVAGFPLQPPASPTGVFGSNLGSFVFSHFGDDGNVELDFVNYTMPGGIVASGIGAGAAVTLNGLPATGFMAYNVINANAQPGLLANYSGVFRHRTTTACTGNVVGCDPIITGGSTP